MSGWWHTSGQNALRSQLHDVKFNGKVDYTELCNSIHVYSGSLGNTNVDSDKHATS